MKRVFFWRVLVLVLAAVMAAAAGILPAMAAEETQTPFFSTSVTRTNPLYATGEAPATSPAEEESAMYVAMDFWEATEALRSLLVERKSAIGVAFPVVLESDPNDQAALEEEMLAYETLLFLGATAHTGNAQEGDYLLFNIYQYAAEIFLAEEEGITFLGVEYNLDYHTTRAQEVEMNIFVTNMINGWNMDSATEYQKVCHVYDWLCENVTYAENVSEYSGVSYSAYGAIMNHESVCQGYAAALYRILLELDVDCRILAGLGGGEAHAWNIVKLGDHYYNVDATWDAEQHAAGAAYRWFLTSDANFPDHERAPEYSTEAFYAAYPMGTKNYGTEVIGSGNCGDNLTWVLTDDGMLIISGTGDMYDYSYENPAPWHGMRSYVTHIVMEKGATNVGNYAFYWCDKLTDITIPEGVTAIGDNAFKMCWSLTGIVIPEGVTRIGEYAFDCCDQMTAAVIPDSVTSIGAYAFTNCSNLTQVAIPDHFTQIPEGLFNRCFHLPNITIPAGVTGIGKEAFSDCDAMTSIVIPENVTVIEDGTFSLCDNLTQITIPAGVTDIGKEAFFGCVNLTAITLPEGVTSIGDAAFGSCIRLAEIVIPSGVTCIGEATFRECESLTQITIPDSVTSIGYGAFQYCKALEQITVPGSVTTIFGRAFEGCSNLTKATLLEGVTTVGDDMFYECGKLAEVTIPESVTSIGDWAFENCTGLTAITIPKGVKSIGGSAFAGCTNLAEVTLTEGLSVIGGAAFSSCTSLVNVTFPKSLADIGGNAFEYCSKLEKLWFQGDAPVIGYDAFRSVKTNAFYPANAVGWDAVVQEYYGGNITWASYAEGEETFAFTGTSVSLGDILDIHFFLSDYEVESTDYAVITRSYADGRADHVVTVPYAQWSALGDGRLYVTYHGIAAKEMNDTLSVVICDSEGNTISGVYTDSVKKYAMRLLHSIQIDGAPQILLVDMLNYGAEAQLFFGYDTEHLANAELTLAERGYASDNYLAENHLSCSEGRAATAVTLKSRLSLDMYFKNSVIGRDYANLYAIVTYTDHYGKPVEYRVEGKDFVSAAGNRVYVSVAGLAIADYRQMVTCTVYDSDGKTLAWATDSVEGYIARMEDEIPAIVGALAKLGSTAQYYFHNYLETVYDPMDFPKTIR